MAGDLPASICHHGIGPSRRVVVPALLGAISLAVIAACPMTASPADGATVINFAANAIGAPPHDFEFGITGHGQPGHWVTVNDESAIGGAAVEQSDHDPTEDRFVFALYRPLSLKDFKASVHLKFVRGTIPSAGIAFRFADAKNYYVVSANALEGRIDVWRVINGKTQRIGGSEAEVVFGHWHTLEIIAQADAFTVAFDHDWLFTAFDRTFNSDGRLGLWSEEDTVTRFAELNITALPASEKH